ncbi:MAG: VOC family protein [Bacteroidales bacterium]
MKVEARFDHYNINVVDLEKSIVFYNKALSLTESKRLVAEDGSYIIVYLKDDASTFLLELTWLKDHPEKYDLGECEFHLCLRVANDYDEIRAYHKSIDAVCYENDEMGLYFIEDPDGYWVEILPMVK